MKVIFLDVDGVINTMKTLGSNLYDLKKEFDTLAMTQLKYIVGKADAHIVISSSWRIGAPDSVKWKILMNNLKKYGIEDKVIGCTTKNNLKITGVSRILFGNDMWAIRSKAIFIWLIENWDKYNIESFVILDDINNMGRLSKFLVVCDANGGITQEISEKSIKILNTITIKEEFLKTFTIK